MIPDKQTAVQLVGPDELVLNTDKEVYKPGPYQVLGEVEAVGLCFSDMKLLHAFTGHPRKGPIVEGIEPEVLNEIPSYVPDELPTVPGHEVVVTIVAVGDKVEEFKVGERYLVQTDYRHLPTDGSKAAFGYNFEGALQQYVLMDTRVIVAPDGESFLLSVTEEPSASAIALSEPWACVEDSYNSKERQTIKKDGKTLIVKEGKGFDPENILPSSAKPAEVVAVGLDGDEIKSIKANVTLADEVPDDIFDDIIYMGSSKETVEILDSKLADRGLMNIVTGGEKFGEPVMIDVGRIHYGGTRYIGNTGKKAADSYKHIPATSEVPAGADILVVGAAGPMGTMHVIRDIALPEHPKSIVGSDINSERLEILKNSVKEAAESKGIEFIAHNPKESGNYEGKADYAVFLPPLHVLLPPVLYNLKPNGVLNIFAGIKSGTQAPVDMDNYTENNLYMIGTSGSTVEDMRIVLAKLDSKSLDTNSSVAAISGMKGAIEGLKGVDSQRFYGKVVVYPQIPDMELIELPDLEKVMPEVAKHLKNGVWTKEAEEALLNK
ncbi:alcohol dehydrogenase catalytic domain-containing protein [Candidatus Poribacteria bacterium]|nr:alcohol dehydrogenase catalytic domain-containing protein [Candidatus Poribacteria bacterium]